MTDSDTTSRTRTGLWTNAGVAGALGLLVAAIAPETRVSPANFVAEAGVIAAATAAFQWVARWMDDRKRGVAQALTGMRWYVPLIAMGVHALIQLTGVYGALGAFDERRSSFDVSSVFDRAGPRTGSTTVLAGDGLHVLVSTHVPQAMVLFLPLLVRMLLYGIDLVRVRMVHGASFTPVGTSFLSVPISPLLSNGIGLGVFGLWIYGVLLLDITLSEQSKEKADGEIWTRIAIASGIAFIVGVSIGVSRSRRLTPGLWTGLVLASASAALVHALEMSNFEW